jgi:hypothetical protein
MTTLNDDLNQKLINFAKFTRENFNDNQTIMQLIAQLELLSIPLFIMYVKSDLLKYAGNMEALRQKMQDEYKIKLETIPPEIQNKFERYFEYFMCIANQY